MVGLGNSLSGFILFKFYKQETVTLYHISDTCPSSQFLCDGNRCLFRRMQCDGIVDCWDQTDENNCSGGCVYYINVEHGK